MEPKLFLRYSSDSSAFITVITSSMSASFSAQGSHLWIFDFQLLRFLVSKYCFLFFRLRVQKYLPGFIRSLHDNCYKAPFSNIYNVTKLPVPLKCQLTTIAYNNGPNSNHISMIFYYKISYINCNKQTVNEAFTSFRWHNIC